MLTIQPAVAQVAQKSWLGAAWQVAQPFAVSFRHVTAGGGGATHCRAKRRGQQRSWHAQLRAPMHGQPAMCIAGPAWQSSMKDACHNATRHTRNAAAAALTTPAALIT